MTNPLSPELIEKVARALFEHDERVNPRSPSIHVRWEGLHPRIKADWLAKGRAAIAALPSYEGMREALVEARDYVEDHSLNTTLTTTQSRKAAAVALQRIDQALASIGDGV
jgi:hypothetical protein